MSLVCRLLNISSLKRSDAAVKKSADSILTQVFNYLVLVLVAIYFIGTGSFARHIFPVDDFSSVGAPGSMSVIHPLF